MLHRKNALFYKTLHGAEVGDVFMSLIHTCQLCAASRVNIIDSRLVPRKSKLTPAAIISTPNPMARPMHRHNRLN